MRLTLPQACLAAVLLSPQSSVVAQVTLVDRDCRELPNVCPLPLDCTQRPVPIDNLECDRCLVDFLGKCQVRGKDPLCEAKKAVRKMSAEADRALQKENCESQNEVNLLQCRKRLDTAIADCRVANSAATGQKPDAYETLLVSGGEGEARKIPEEVRNRLVQSGLYDARLVDGIQVLKLSSTARVPPALEELPIGFSVGDRIFVKIPSDVDLAPLDFWVRQLEMSRLYAEYGVKDLGVALTRNPTTIFDLVQAKVAKNCAILKC